MKRRVIAIVILIICLLYGITGCDLSKNNDNQKKQILNTESSDNSSDSDENESTSPTASDSTTVTESTEEKKDEGSDIKESNKNDETGFEPLQADDDFNITEELGEDQGMGGK